MIDPAYEVAMIHVTIAKGVGLPIFDSSMDRTLTHPQLFMKYEEAFKFAEDVWAPKLIKAQNTGRDFQIFRSGFGIDVRYMDWLNRASLAENESGEPLKAISQIVSCEIRFRVRFHMLPELVINKLKLLGE